MEFHLLKQPVCLARPTYSANMRSQQINPDTSINLYWRVIAYFFFFFFFTIWARLYIETGYSVHWITLTVFKPVIFLEIQLLLKLALLENLTIKMTSFFHLIFSDGFFWSGTQIHWTGCQVCLMVSHIVIHLEAILSSQFISPMFWRGQRKTEESLMNIGRVCKTQVVTQAQDWIPDADVVRYQN